jgi:hypothetical protein
VTNRRDTMLGFSMEDGVTWQCGRLCIAHGKVTSSGMCIEGM